MLQLNGEKSELIVFAPKNKIALTDKISINIGGSVVRSKCVVRNLGVHLDQTLKFDKHINQKCRSCVYQLRNICKIRKYLTTDATKSLVHALVISHLDYANAVLSSVSNTLVYKLQKIQNFAARVISGTSRNSHITPVLRALHWLPVKQRIQYKIIVLAFQMIHGLAPSYLCELITIYKPRRSLRSKDKIILCPPKTACSLWNTLPSNIRQITSLCCFKSVLKTHLFKLTFY